MKMDAISINAEVMDGVPVFKGTRVPIENLFQWLETETMEEFLENFPTVSKEQVVQVLEAARQIDYLRKSVACRFCWSENIPFN